ncbi:MAG: ribonuclease HI family protein [Phycisphaerae bacterium]|nr:ribonuclease HI family protein [Phycisphaerae bacterium]
MKLSIHIDGGSRGNPGPAGAGVSVQDASGRPVFEAGFFLGQMTNNMAEYTALLRALDFAVQAGASELAVFSDSELLVRQINGEYRVRNATLRELFCTAVARLREIDQWNIQHVRREANRRADELANMAMDAGKDVVVRDEPGTIKDDRSGPRRSPVETRASRPCHRAGSAVETGAGGRCRSAPSDSPSHDGASCDRPDADRVVVVRCENAPGANVCPASCKLGAEFTFARTVPPGVCLDVAAELVLAVHRARATGGAVDVACPRGGCGARFRVGVARAGGCE